MSFTKVAKEEISKVENSDIEKISELSAIIQCNAIIGHSIMIMTENHYIANYVDNLIHEVCKTNSKVTVRKGYNYSKNLHYIIEINNNPNILRNLGIAKDEPEEFIYADDELIKAYLKGVFLMCGSINDPKTSRYHLEFNLSNKNYANFISRLLNIFELKSKVLSRENRYMVYIKEAEKISDFLRLMRASNAVLYYEDIRIYRDHKNMTNRLNNCEQANVDKIIETANRQLHEIDILEKNIGLEILNDKEKEVVFYRKKYPESSLIELAEIISIETGKNITKSGLYHRFRKISMLAEKVNKNK